MVKKGMSTDDAFTYFMLDKAGGNLFSHPYFKIWRKYVGKVNKKNPDSVVITTLTTHYGGANLAKLLQHALTLKGAKRTAAKLQRAQFEQWHKKGRTPLNVVDEAKYRYTGYLINNHPHLQRLLQLIAVFSSTVATLTHPMPFKHEMKIPLTCPSWHMRSRHRL